VLYNFEKRYTNPLTGYIFFIKKDIEKQKNPKLQKSENIIINRKFIFYSLYSH